MADKYCIYEHVFPNGKRYIGISADAEKRWRKDGSGYKTQGKIWNAIQHYGWNNIRHNIILDNLSREQATSLEVYLISALNTIENGYNTTIGGENITSTYLDDYLLSMIRYARKHFSTNQIGGISFGEKIIYMPIECYNDRYNEEAAEFWNEAARAVTNKHRKFSPTDEVDVRSFWFHIREYYLLWLKMQTGQDVSEWEEMTEERSVFDNLFKGNAV